MRLNIKGQGLEISVGERGLRSGEWSYSRVIKGELEDGEKRESEYHGRKSSRAMTIRPTGTATISATMPGAMASDASVDVIAASAVESLADIPPPAAAAADVAVDVTTCEDRDVMTPGDVVIADVTEVVEISPRDN